jgi:hypothetical protein
MSAQEQGFSAPRIDAIMLKGGLDQITPSLSLQSGAVRHALNFEASVAGGYSRIKGYERFDGRPSPSEAAESGAHRYISVALFSYVPVIGDTLTASGGATGVLAYIDGPVMVLTKVSGVLAIGETISATAGLVGTINNVAAGPTGSEQDAIVRGAVAAIYRADIFAVPGSGPIRGVVEFGDTVYGFRDTLAGTALAVYRSTASGWELVPFYKTVSFTGGGTTAPADGSTLTEGGVTATIKRVVLTSGDWPAGTAAGQLVITDPVGGSFSAGAATIGAVNVTLSGAETAIAMLPGGRFEFDEHNFFGQAASDRVYGCDGVNRAFEFDGDVLAPIATGSVPDAPTHVCAHRGFLFLSVGSSALHSAPGLPFDWTAINGAEEFAMGDTITGMISMPGGTTGSTLGIASRNNTYILYGTNSADWNLVSFNTGSGACNFSLQNLAQTFAFDDRGVVSIQSAMEYGNFNSNTLTNGIQPFINQHINMLTASTLCRRKSQYRLFFSDGAGLFITVANNTLMGCMPMLFPDVVRCTYEGKRSDGTDIMYFGTDDGMIHQMEKGTSFDGAAMDYYLVTNYSNAKSPRTLKRYRKAALEITSENGCYAAFDFATVLGYDSAEYSQPRSESFAQYTGQTRWDSFIWDDFFWDSNRVEPIECGLEGTAENISVLLSGTSDIVPSFTVNSVLVHYSPRRMMR